MEIDRQLLFPAFYYANTSDMPVSLTAWLCVKMYTSVEHDLCPTCYERPPVLSDRFDGQKGWSPKTGSTVMHSYQFAPAVKFFLSSMCSLMAAPIPSTGPFPWLVVLKSQKMVSPCFSDSGWMADMTYLFLN